MKKAVSQIDGRQTQHLVILYFPIAHNALRLGGQDRIQDGWLVRSWGRRTFVARRTVRIGGIEKKIFSFTEFLKKKSCGKYGCFG